MSQPPSQDFQDEREEGDEYRDDCEWVRIEGPINYYENKRTKECLTESDYENMEDEKEDPSERLDQLFELADTDFGRNLINYIYRVTRKAFTNSRIAAAEGRRLSGLALISYLNGNRMSRVLALNEEDCSIDARDDIIQYYVLELIDRLGSNPLNELDGEVLEELRQDEWHYDVSENLDNVVAFSFQTDSAEMSESKAGEGYDNPVRTIIPVYIAAPNATVLSMSLRRPRSPGVPGSA